MVMAEINTEFEGENACDGQPLLVTLQYVNRIKCRGSLKLPFGARIVHLEEF